MIEIKNLTKVYGNGAKRIHALQQIDLEIHEGMFGLLGPNGAGKTTTIKMLAGLIEQDSGSISFPAFKRRPRRRPAPNSCRSNTRDRTRRRSTSSPGASMLA